MECDFNKAMHFLCFLIFVIGLILGCGSDASKKNAVRWENGPQIVGKWEASNKGGHKIVFEFAQDGHMLIHRGRKFTSLDINESPISYHLDASSTPMKLDFVSSRLPDDELRKMKLIAEFLTNDKLKIKLSDGPQRPERFKDGSKYEILLDRVE